MYRIKDYEKRCLKINNSLQHIYICILSLVYNRLPLHKHEIPQLQDTTACDTSYTASESPEIRYHINIKVMLHMLQRFRDKNILYRYKKDIFIDSKYAHGRIE